MKIENEKEIQEIHNYGISITNRELFLHDVEYEIDQDVAITFIKNLNILQCLSKKPIIIHQFSYGGCWDAGICIYDAIKSCSCPVVFVTHGFAGSMGSIMPQAALYGGLRVSMENCIWMLHEGSSGFEGTHKQMRSRTTIDEIILKKMYQIYTDSCFQSKFYDGYTESQVKAKIKNKLGRCEDWYMSAQDAADYGLIDYVITEEFGLKDAINEL